MALKPSTLFGIIAQAAVFRYRVDREAPNRVAISWTDTSAVLSSAAIVLRSLPESFSQSSTCASARSRGFKPGQGSLTNEIAFKTRLGHRRNEIRCMRACYKPRRRTASNRLAFSARVHQIPRKNSPDELGFQLTGKPVLKGTV